MKFFGDYHTHSEYSHGRGNLKENIETALKKGLRELAVTDHGPLTWNFIRLGVKASEDLLKIKEIVNSLQIGYPEIKLYSGVEANIINSAGDLDVSRRVLEKLDITAVGFHLLLYPYSYHSYKDIVINNRIIYKLRPEKRKEIRKKNTEALVKTVQKYRVDLVTHPGYGVDIDTYDLAQVCAEEGTYLEINARHSEILEGFIKTALKTEVKFIVNSDAHSPAEIGEFNKAIKLINKMAVPSERIVNLVK